MDDAKGPLLIALFTEVGIVSQLSRALVEARLPKGMTASHFWVMMHLIRVGDGSTPLDIARAFQVAKTTMTHTLAGLVKFGFVEMRPNPKDGRSKQIWMTESGRKFQQETFVTLRPDIAQLAGKLSVETLGPLVSALGDVRAIMDENRQEDD